VTRPERPRLCGCYYCSARRECEARALYRGPGRLRAKLGHLVYRVRLRLWV
jgi:hypothetical protein